MDKLVRKIEIPLAKKAIERAGLYIVQEKDMPRLAQVRRMPTGTIPCTTGSPTADMTPKPSN